MRTILTLLAVLLFSADAFAGVVFESSFNDISSWATNWCGANAYCVSGTCTGAGMVAAPTGWDSYYTEEEWNPSCSTPTAGSKPVMSVDTTSGSKAFTFFTESTSGKAGDGWGANGVLAKDLGQDYSEIYLQMKIKFPVGYQWAVDHVNNDMLKVVRFQHWNRTGNPFTFFTSGYSEPVYLFDILNSTDYGFYEMNSYRCAPKDTNYYCNMSYQYGGSGGTEKVKYPGNATFSASVGDGNWHTLKWQAKMNSGVGVADGVLRFWLDGAVVYEKTDVKWIDTGSTLRGWNYVGIGGNAHNNYANITSYPFTYTPTAEQWYAIDDVVVSTTPIPDNYVIGSAVTPTITRSLNGSLCGSLH